MNKQDLEEIYREVYNRFDNQTISWLHLRSIGNFLNYFDKLHVQHQELVAQKLFNYFNFLKTNRHLFATAKTDSLFLFSEYINPIGVIYQKELDFGVKIKLWMNILTSIILICICLILNSIIIDIVLFSFLLWYGIRQYRRSRLGKFYKYQY